MKTSTSPVSRLKKLFTKKIVIVSVIIVALTLNLITFVFAYPEMFKSSSSTLARDFSAYYIGGWRLFHNPTKIYAGGSQPGDYQILPKPQTFKYTPSFLILISPFLILSYQDAFIAFNIVQLASMLALAFFVYKLVKDKNLYACCCGFVPCRFTISQAVTNCCLLSFNPRIFSGVIIGVGFVETLM